MCHLFLIIYNNNEVYNNQNNCVNIIKNIFELND